MTSDRFDEVAEIRRKIIIEIEAVRVTAKNLTLHATVHAPGKGLPELVGPVHVRHTWSVQLQSAMSNSGSRGSTATRGDQRVGYR
ncbi:hypothetical protein CV023_03480 [Brevibacterium sp. CCUG 69071]|nr:hypothetical protein [Brevibacterium sp. CCUG 69071]